MQELATLTSAADNGGSSSIGGWIFPLLIVLLIVYFFSTQRRRAKAQQQQLSQIVPGTLVVTTAGLYATVVEQDGSDVLLEIAPDVVCRFGRNAIARVISTPDAEGESDTADGDHSAPAGTSHGDTIDTADGSAPSDSSDEADGTGTTGASAQTGSTGSAGGSGTAGSAGGGPRPDGDVEGTGGNPSPPRKEL